MSVERKRPPPDEKEDVIVRLDRADAFGMWLDA
jgi:hypothetical protein